MKQFKVKIWVGSSPSEVIVPAANSANALRIAKNLYPMARVISARSL
jgi:hypothetical protein